MSGGISWLDVKLGARMLVKYPGLALVGGVGMAVAIAIGAAFFDVSSAYLDSSLPLDEGDRIVAIQNWDATTGRREHPWIRDFTAWREEVASVQELGGFQPHWRNLIASDGQAEPVSVAVMTASGFRVARVPPLLGRTLLDEDEVEGAPPVIVIGHDVWQKRFAGDPAVVGRTIQLGNTPYAIVGVMPEGFAFPINHRLWTALPAARAVEAAEQPVFVFGRLAPGASRERAQAELTALGQRTAAALPGTHEHIRPRIVPYTYPLVGLDDDGDRWEIHLMQILVSLLLVVVCVNVAILIYARTATREGEITVRSALGASRRRIVAQLFVEALVLAAVAAVAGLMIAQVGLRQAQVLVQQQMADGLPFWMEFGLSPATIVYVVGLAMLAALIAGVVPAVQATGSRLQAGLRQLGGATGMRLGRTWTTLIVVQVAFAVAVLPAAVYMVWDSVRLAAFRPGFAAESFLTARIAMDGELAADANADDARRAFTARYAAQQAELVRRLEAEPGVADVTLAMDLPGVEPTAYVEIDGTEAAPASVRRLRVDPDFFEAFGAPLLAGRRLHATDRDPEATAVVVNQRFARDLLGGSAVGRRVRYVADRQPPADVDTERWYDIVGVVSDFPAMPIESGMPEARLYHAMEPGQVYPVSAAIRLAGGSPTTFAVRFREIATGVDPTLRLHDVLPLDEVYRQQQVGMRLAAWALGLVTLSVLLLSSAGIYALMSFTVARRRREIGIRAALGAPPREIVASIFSRAAGQLAIGVAVGVAVAGLLERLTGGQLMDGQGAVLLPVLAALMVVVGLAAAYGPARRGLRIEPTEALREG